MKNLLIVLATVCLPALAGINEASAQARASSDPAERRKNSIETEIVMTPVSNPKTGVGEINPKAVKNFTKTYKDVTGEKWITTRDGCYAEFNSNGIRNTIFYQNNGHWFGSVKSYTEEKLPVDVRTIVKREYFDYSIYFVQELETMESLGIPTYIIHIEDKNNLKLIRIFDGQMEVWKEYVKG